MKCLIVSNKVIAIGEVSNETNGLKVGSVIYFLEDIQGYLLVDVPVNLSVKSGWSYNEGVFTPSSTVLQKVVPQTVTRRQAKQALALAGLLDSVEGALTAIPDATTRKLATIEWQDSLEFQRNRPLVIQLATSLGLTSDDLDNLFITAATL